MAGVSGAVRATQPALPGLEGAPAVRRRRVVSPQALVGRWVYYLGRVRGGPPFGARGLVAGVRGGRVVVRFPRHGTWYVPLAFLGAAEEAPLAWPREALHGAD